VTPPENALQLLRTIYHHVDREAVLREHPELDESTLVAFFGNLKRLLEAETSPQPADDSGKSLQGAESVVLYSDGGSRGNPGPAGYGFVLLTEKGKTLAEGDRFLGRITNNVAEYEGLLAGLRKARELGARRVVVRSDSELLVRQLNGSYRVKSPKLKPLFERVKRIAASFDSCQFTHVRRHQNRRADELANKAMDRGA